MTTETAEKTRTAKDAGNSHPLDDILNDAGDAIGLPPASHTRPTQEEIRAQARLCDPMLAVHKETNLACDARCVEDGMAFRPLSSPKDADYEWMRPGDFESQYTLFTFVDAEERRQQAQAIAELAIESSRLRRALDSSRRVVAEVYQAAGKKGRARINDRATPSLRRYLESVTS